MKKKCVVISEAVFERIMKMIEQIDDMILLTSYGENAKRYSEVHEKLQEARKKLEKALEVMKDKGL